MLITILIQMVIMRELERMIGWWRMVILYFGSGIAGSLGSAIFLPYVVEVSYHFDYFKMIFGYDPSEEFELTGSTQQAHMKPHG